MKRFIFLAAGPLVLALVAPLLVPDPAMGHEPVFGVGPEVIYREGVGVEVGLDVQDNGGDRLLALDYELIYGVTKNLALTVEFPQALRRETGEESNSGIGDVLVRGKYRFWNRNRLNYSDRASVIFGLKLPTGAHHGAVPLGSGSFDPLIGISVAHESRTWYGFGTFRYLFRTPHDGLNRGNLLLLDVAGGVRPWQTQYLQPDLVLLLEFNWESAPSDVLSGKRLRASGGDVGWFGPTALLSYRNIMAKTGIQLPAFASLNGDQDRPRARAIFSLEYHF